MKTPHNDQSCKSACWPNWCVRQKQSLKDDDHGSILSLFFHRWIREFIDEPNRGAYVMIQLLSDIQNPPPLVKLKKGYEALDRDPKLVSLSVIYTLQK